ncbi:MAG: 2-oxo acid dehydrogenase subunit E2 [Myxococcota bacterium]|nr:2-oxo acid dehydrogenase subunit E2 [Myxococcota bacterium]
MGGIAQRPPLSPSDPSPREVLCLTVSANHELVDGGPLARFTGDFCERLKRGDGLPEVPLPMTTDH